MEGSRRNRGSRRDSKLLSGTHSRPVGSQSARRCSWCPRRSPPRSLAVCVPHRKPTAHEGQSSWTNRPTFQNDWGCALACAVCPELNCPSDRHSSAALIASPSPGLQLQKGVCGEHQRRVKAPLQEVPEQCSGAAECAGRPRRHLRGNKGARSFRKRVRTRQRLLSTGG